MVGNQTWSSAKVICRVDILPDLRKPFPSEISVKLSKTVRANDSQTAEVQCTALQDLQSKKIILFATSEKQTPCNTIKGI